MLDLLIEAAVGSIEVPAEGDGQQRLVALYTSMACAGSSSWNRGAAAATSTHSCRD